MKVSRHRSICPPVERSMIVSAPQRSAHCSFSSSSSVPELTGEAPMLALILVVEARPMHIGSSWWRRCTLLAGMIMRPAATSTRICSTLRCASRSATRFISGVISPARAHSSWVTGFLPFSFSQSIALIEDGSGIPGVSGEQKARRPPISGLIAKEAGLVPSFSVDGLLPRPGSSHSGLT